MKERNSLSVIFLIFSVFIMFALAFASVPLYKIFCQKTGFGGTPKISKSTSSIALDREIVVRFLATTHQHLP